MKSNHRALRFVPIAAIGISMIITILQTLAYRFSYEAPKSNYFAVGAPLPIIAWILGAIGLVGGLLVILPSKDFLAEGNLPAPKASLLIAAGFLASAAVLALSTQDRLSRLTVMLLLFSAVYELSIAFLTKLDSALKALIGFSSVLSCILLNAIYYFDTSLEMNAPIKVTLLVGLLCSMLYFTAELRFLLKKRAAKLHAILAVAMLAFGALTALPLPIAFATGILNRSNTPAGAPFLERYVLHPEYLAGALTVLGVCIGAAIRLRAQLRYQTENVGAQTALENEDTQPIEKEQEEA